MKAYFVIGKDKDLYEKILSVAFSLEYHWAGSTERVYNFRYINDYEEGIGIIFTFRSKIIQFTGLKALTSNTSRYFHIKSIGNLICWLKTEKMKMKIG